MKQLLITIAAVVLAGCEAQPPDILIHEAANKGNAEAVRQHIAASRDMNAKGNGGYTPLHYAASNYAASKKEIAQLLITAGADVNAQDDNGETPLDWENGLLRVAKRQAQVDRHRDATEIAELLRKHS